MPPFAATQVRQHSVPPPTIKTAVAGVSGYAGGELARLLLHHPRLTQSKPAFLGRVGEPSSGKPVLLSDLHPQLASGDGSDLEILPFQWDRLVASGIEILFLATPHEQSREWVPEAIARGIRVIDLSGAWRLQDDRNRAVYNLTDADPALAQRLQTEAVYGCPELHRDTIRTARLVANPGCYATSVILALAPLLQAGVVDIGHGIICDAKSGVSGAGKSLVPSNQFMYAADNLSAYKVFGHRHTGELLEQLHLAQSDIQFTPHLLPIPRGILSTIYLRLNAQLAAEKLEEIFAAFYKSSPLVRLRGSKHLPQIQYVVKTNYCDIGFELEPNGSRLVVVSCLDNLLKGAAGQAVQNMNLMCGWNESEGLL
jgi:N-acetyl-gamma-glutamyl-phosphate reductase